jgi:hypothetical protein
MAASDPHLHFDQNPNFYSASKKQFHIERRKTEASLGQSRFHIVHHPHAPIAADQMDLEVFVRPTKTSSQSQSWEEDPLIDLYLR